MTYVYILSDYDEYGAENVTATLDRARLHDLIAENWPVAMPEFDACRQAEWVAEAQARLAVVLLNSDEDLAVRDGTNLHDGWGGAQLHVVRLA